ncbi:dihydrodipicolinate synthase family protein [Nakamurella sp. YIM 132087]|uniref:Dihydrodipicolinate synthase family protein n=1 Tax=Nakamurella alba TaxID=2665158 RepID=A0A7K1FML9_9ACTN|nr:dihydrodipicolinate synthase family protein [Nakamurella alba]MTD15330.1 dihydrodipicolinate synthase family protein [Nakamurella alba]
MTVPALYGVIPPLVTPLSADGSVDEKAMAELAESQLAAGVDGLFVGGSSGEVALLDTEQLTAAVSAAARVAAGSVPVLAGSIETGTRRVIATARQVVAAGADAVVTTAPFYIAPHDDEIIGHFAAVAAAIDAPVVAYDYPAGTAQRLRPHVVAELHRQGSVIGLKDSSGDLVTFREILRLVPDLPVLTGSELLADTALSLGAAGLVPGLGNVDPEGYVRLYRAAKDGRWADAAAEQDRLARLFRIVSVADTGRIGFTAGALGAFKAAMVLRGTIPDGRVNPPMLPLQQDEIDRIAGLLADAGL